MKKDWKKRTNSLGGVQYTNKKSRYSFARVWKPAFPYPENKWRKLIWNFSARIGLKGNEIKRYFKNKKDTLDYAEEWIMDH